MLTATSAIAAEVITVKIGYVDLVKSLNESEAGKKAKTDLEFLIKTKQTTIDEKGKAIVITSYSIHYTKLYEFWRLIAAVGAFGSAARSDLSPSSYAACVACHPWDA